MSTDPKSQSLDNIVILTTVFLHHPRPSAPRHPRDLSRRTLLPPEPRACPASAFVIARPEGPWQSMSRDLSRRTPDLIRGKAESGLRPPKSRGLKNVLVFSNDYVNFAVGRKNPPCQTPQAIQIQGKNALRVLRMAKKGCVLANRADSRSTGLCGELKVSVYRSFMAAGSSPVCSAWGI